LVSRAQRDKGLRRERQLITLHTDIGIKCERVPLSGSVRYRGNGTDIDLYLRGQESAPWNGECKARGNGEGFATIKRWLGEADVLFLMEDRCAPLIVLPWKRWAELLEIIRR
jgi:hypothetical protein